jgi:uncharacterized membrane protein
MPSAFADSLPPLARQGAEGEWGQSQPAMSNPHANFDSNQRRAGVRRTVWVVGGFALAMFVLFFLKQAIWH